MDLVFAFAAGDGDRDQGGGQPLLLQNLKQKAAGIGGVDGEVLSKRLAGVTGENGHPFQFVQHSGQNSGNLGVGQTEGKPVGADKPDYGIADGNVPGVVKAVAFPVEFEDGERGPIDALAEIESEEVPLCEIGNFGTCHLLFEGLDDGIERLIDECAIEDLFGAHGEVAFELLSVGVAEFEFGHGEELWTEAL